jgi:transmembrane sensor
MNEWDALGRALRDELGAPPAELQERQLRRIKNAPLGPRPRPRRQWALATALSAAILGVGYFVTIERSESSGRDNEMPSDWIEATSSSLPYRTPDGSSIRLEEGSRGRFSSNEEGSHFDLHNGRATFEVTKRRGQDWTVAAGRYSLHVVGTRFSVSYQQSKLGVWVEEGRVAVSVPQRSDLILLEAGDQLMAEGDRLTLDTQGNPANGWGAASTSVDSESGTQASADPTADPLLPADPAHITPPAAAFNADEADWHALYAKGQYAEALRKAKHIGFETLMNTLSGSRLVDLADTARLGGDSAAALKALRALESRFPEVAAARDADFLMARLHAQRGETTAAIRGLTSYLERGEGTRYSLEALGRLIDLHSRSGHREEARSLAKRYLSRAPKGPYHRLAESVLQQK